MEWSQESDSGAVMYSATTLESSWHRLRDPISEFLACLMNSIAQSPPSGFDQVGFEIWLDSGRIIGYSASTKTPKDDKSILVQLSVELVYSLFDLLPDSDSAPAAFDAEVITLQTKVTSSLIAASLRDPGKTAIAKLRATHPFTCWFQFASDVSSRRFTSI